MHRPYLFFLALDHPQKEEGPRGQDDSVRFRAGGGRRHELTVLVPPYFRFRHALGLAVEGQGLVLGHRHGGGVLRDVG